MLLRAGMLAGVAFVLTACGEPAAEVAPQAATESPAVAQAQTQISGSRQSSPGCAETVQETQVISLENGATVKVVAAVACLDRSTYPRPEADHWTGIPASAAADTPNRLIRRLDVVVNNETELLPVSAYGDLLFTDDLQIDARAAGSNTVIKLSAHGSAGGWVATLTFSGAVLIERYVTSTAFPDEAAERTQYSTPTDN